MWCTQWPTSAFGSGMYCERSPRLIGFQLAPPSSVRKAPAAEMAMYILCRIAGIKNDGVQTHAARARLPLGAGAVSAQPGEFLPVLAAVGRAEDGGVFHAGVNRVGIGERRLQVPHPLELPGMLRAVVPLMRGQRRGRRVVGELVALAFGRAVGQAVVRPSACPAGARSCRHRRSAG